MSRLPFDPKKVAGPEPAKTPDRYTVSQAVDLIKTTLETRMPSPLRVIGQVSNLSIRNHWYFSLKDEDAVLHCAAWATAVRKFGFTPKDGDEVVATGHISHYPQQGRTQLYVDQLMPVGAGALELKFRALCDELRGLGYFDEDRKKPLPIFPRRIAVITSAGGAALQDVIATAAQRCKAVGLLIVDVRVQGEGAAADVAKAIRWVNAQHKRMGVDAMLVTRGGGSLEDLWAFNERLVADAVYTCALPIVAAIGHESDTTIIELVADRRAATPTQAAMMLVPSAKDMHKHLDHVSKRLMLLLSRNAGEQAHRLRRLTGDLLRIVKARVSQARVEFERLGRRLAQSQPRAQLVRRQTLLAVLRDRMHRAVALHMKRLRATSTAARNRLSAVDPSAVLNRGYTITMTKAGAVIRSVKDVHVHDSIRTRLRDGEVESVATGAGGSASRSRKQPHSTDGEMDLFSAAR